MKPAFLSFIGFRFVCCLLRIALEVQNKLLSGVKVMAKSQNKKKVIKFMPKKKMFNTFFLITDYFYLQINTCEILFASSILSAFTGISKIGTASQKPLSI